MTVLPLRFVQVVCAALLLAACGGLSGHSDGITDDDPTPCASTTPSPGPAAAPLWSPPGAAAPVQAVIADGGTVQLRTGQRVRFRDLTGTVSNPASNDLTKLTWYGDARTFLALAPGTVKVTVANYDQRKSGASAPCAHLNAPISMTVQISPDPHAPIPLIPQGPVRLTDVQPRQLTLPVGGQLTLGPGLELRGAWGPDALLADTRTGYVASHPGHESFTLDGQNHPDRQATIKVTVVGLTQDPCRLLSWQDAQLYTHTVDAVQVPLPGEASGPIPSVTFCSYWGGQPATRTPVVSVGIAAGHRTEAQVHAELADYAGYATIVPDPRLPAPAFLQSSTVGGQPDLQLYLLAHGLELTVELRAPHASAADVEKLARIALTNL